MNIVRHRLISSPWDHMGYLVKLLIPFLSHAQIRHELSHVIIIVNKVDLFISCIKTTDSKGTLRLGRLV